MSGVEQGGELAGRIAVVTGAGSGIGRATALALAREGAIVAALECDADGLRETAGLIEQAGGECLSIPCDVSDAAAVDAAAAQVADALGPCRILVNNAGIIRPGALADLSLADWSMVLGINLTGCFLCARAFGAHMRAEKCGEMVHLASITSDFATPMAGAYSVTKAGIAMLSRQLAIELGPEGIRSNAVKPGMILTGLSRDMYARPGVAEARSAMIPAGRIGEPEDIAEAILFLVSDRAAYVTGEEITVDGGFVRNLLGLTPRAGYERETRKG